MNGAAAERNPPRLQRLRAALMRRAPWRVVLELGGWVLLLGLASLVAAHLFGVTGPGVMPLLYSALPNVLLLAIPGVVLFNWLRWYRLAVPFAAVFVYLLVMLAPHTITSPPSAVPADATRVRVMFSNVWQVNPTADAAMQTILAQNADIVVLTEIAETHLLDETWAAIRAAYPVIIAGPSPFVVMTRLPEPALRNFPVGDRFGTELLFETADKTLRLMVVHPQSPGRRSSDDWKRGIADVQRALTPMQPGTLVVGDFNTATWNPMYSDVLDLGYEDVHQRLGKGLTTSWPVRGHRYPAFVRINHTLTSPGVTPVAITDVDVVGSDHTAFVVDVAISDPPSID